MRHMISIALLVFSSLAIAAEATTARSWDRIAAAIELSDKQVEQLKSAEARMLREISRVKTAFNAHEVTRSEAGRLVNAARESFERAWQEIVTDEQKRSWRELHARSRKSDRAPSRETDRAQESDRARESDRVRTDAPLWRRIGAVVDLTREQVGLLAEVEAAYQQRLRRILNAAKDGSLSRDEAGDHIKRAGVTLREAVGGVLTDDQIARLREVHTTDRRSDRDAAAPTTLLDVDPPGDTAIQESSWGVIKSRAWAR